jgi:hypothetical protein
LIGGYLGIPESDPVEGVTGPHVLRAIRTTQTYKRQGRATSI